MLIGVNRFRYYKAFQLQKIKIHDFTIQERNHFRIEDIDATRYNTFDKWVQQISELSGF